MKIVLYGQRPKLSKVAFIARDFQQKGLRVFVRSHIQKSFLDPLSKFIFDQTVARRPLRIDGKNYLPLSYRYNFTWQNERSVEIAYFQERIQEVSSEKILEVGNVLSHYFPTHHTILDKYEKAPGVINTDIIDYKPPHAFEKIIAISTLEHIGWHEKGHDAQKALRAIKHLRSLLTSNGTLIFSIPFGINPALDKAMYENSLPLTKKIYLHRVNRWNVWKQCSLEDIQDAQYNYPFPSVNALLIGEMRRR